MSRSSVNQTFKQYILQYRSIFCQRSFDMFYWLVLDIICLEEVRSIKFLYDNFIGKYTKKALNSVYFFLSYLDFHIDVLILNTITVILSIIPGSLRGMTIFLTIDDTLQDKYGDKFDCYFKFFDHANKNGSQYLNGHCFVTLVLNIPLYYKEKVRCLSIPVGYKLYSKEKSKLKLAFELISTAMSKLNGYQVILLCDSWYSKRYKLYRFGSPQTIRRVIADNILKELFFDSFLVSLENNTIYSVIKKAVYLFLDNSNVA